MSDTTTMPFQPGTMATAPEAPEFDEPSGNNRMLLLLGALAGLAVLAIAAYFLLFAGGDDTKTPANTTAAPSVTQPSTAPSTAPKTAVQPKISKRNFGTNPFKPLLSDDATVTGTVAGTTTGTTTTGTTTGTTTTGTTAGGTTNIPTDPVPTASKSYTFRVVSAGPANKLITVKVNGKTYKNLHAGDVFAKVFKVRGIGGNTNVFQVGKLIYSITGNKAVTVSS